MIRTILKTLGADLSKVKFVVGSEYQLKPEVTMELFKLASVVKVSHASKAGTEVVKQSKDPMLTSLIYPLLQFYQSYMTEGQKLVLHSGTQCVQ